MMSGTLRTALFFLMIGGFVRLSAQPSATQPARRLAGADPNWIGPRSWQRHFTIPPFVLTSRGWTVEAPATRPATAGGGTRSYWASRSTRTGSTTSGGTTAYGGTASSSGSARAARAEGAAGGRAEGVYGGYGERSSRRSSSEGRRSSRSSRRSERSRDSG